jgi:hypothetical protein
MDLNAAVMSEVYKLKSTVIFVNEITFYTGRLGESDSAVGCTALQAGRSPVRFSMMSLKFLIDIILPAAFWSWGRLSL